MLNINHCESEQVIFPKYISLTIINVTFSWFITITLFISWTFIGFNRTMNHFDTTLDGTNKGHVKTRGGQAHN